MLFQYGGAKQFFPKLRLKWCLASALLQINKYNCLIINNYISVSVWLHVSRLFIVVATGVTFVSLLYMMVAMAKRSLRLTVMIVFTNFKCEYFQLLPLSVTPSHQHRVIALEKEPQNSWRAQKPSITKKHY